MLNLTEIQELVREHTRTGNLVITSGDGLAHANFVMRETAILVQFEDLTVVQTDSRFVTTADTGAYTFDFSPHYIDLKLAEVQDYADGNAYKRVVPARSEHLWAAAGREVSDLPRLYRFTANKVASSFEVRPVPKVSSSQFRFTGIIEPEPWTEDDSEVPTVFRRHYDDDIVALMISAYELAKQGDQIRAQQVFMMGARMARDSQGLEIQPKEMREALHV